MNPRDMAVAAFTSIGWGLAFAAVKFGLQSFSATELVAVRFLIAGLPVFLVPRPKVGWTSIVLIGMTLFTGQFLLLFLAYRQGMPPGLASVTQQTQAFFTVLLAAAFLRERPAPRQIAGMIIAFAGLGLIAATAGSDVTWEGLSLALAGALSWAVGNILVKRTAKVPIFPLVVWCSLVPPLPALLLSSVVDPGHRRFLPALLHASSISIAAALYLGVVATLFGYAAWGYLLRRYSAAIVAPFALIAPCAGVVSSALLFGEAFPPVRYAGMVLILGGLAVVLG